MDFKRKIEIVEQSVRSISRADDTDAAVRHAALDRIAEFVADERGDIDKRVAGKIAEAIGAPKKAEEQAP